MQVVGNWQQAQKQQMKNLVKEASEFIFGKTGFSGKTAIILGSGLGAFTDPIIDKQTIPYASIPDYPQPTVAGHAGELVTGIIHGKSILVAKGRFHCYEGHSIETVNLPIRVFHALGVQNLIITNSAGSMNKENVPGTLMVIEGHIDFTFRDSAADPELIRSDKFHSRDLISIARKTANEQKINLSFGNYCWALGPAYETPAEIQYFQSMNGDAVGMSTVPEIREAGKLGMRILTISTLTNFAAGITKNPLTHDEVMEYADKARNDFIGLISGIIEKL